MAEVCLEPFKNHWEFFPNFEPDFSEQFLFVKPK